MERPCDDGEGDSREDQQEVVSSPSSPRERIDLKKRKGGWLTGAKSKNLTAEVIDLIPEHLESKFYGWASSCLLHGESILSFYRHTSTFLLSPYRTASGPQQVVNNSPMVTYLIKEPLLVSLHEDGVLQIFDTEREVGNQYQVVEKENAKQFTCVLFNMRNLFMISSNLILHYVMKNIESTPRSIHLGGQEKLNFPVNQSYSHLMSDTLLLIGGSFEMQVIDIGNSESGEEANVVLSMSAPGEHTSFLFTGCSSSTIVGATREALRIWTIQGEPGMCVEYTFNEGVIVTSLHVDEDFIVLGHSNGLVAVRQTDNGKFLRDLNIIGTPDDTDPSWDAQLSGIRLNGKVNHIKRVGKWIFCAFNNGKVAGYEVMQSNASHPLVEFSHTSPVAVSSIVIENGYVFLLLKPDGPGKKKSKKNDDDEKPVVKKPTLIVWQPVFKKREENKEFEILTEFYPKSKADGDFFEETAPVRFLAVSQDGKKLSSLHDDGVIRVWDAMTKRLLAAFEIRAPVHQSTPHFFRWVNGLLFIACGNIIQTFDVEKNAWVHLFSGHQDDITNCFFPIGEEKSFYTVSKDGHCIKWDYGGNSNQKGQASASILCHALPILGCTVFDGSLYTSSEDKTIKSFGLEEGKADFGKCKKMFIGHSDSVTEITIITVNFVDSLFSLSKDNTIRSWDKNATTCLRIIPLVKNEMWRHVHLDHMDGEKVQLFFTQPHERYTTEDKYVVSWSIKAGTGKVANYFMGHKEAVYKVAMGYQQFRRTLFTCSHDGSIISWDPDSGQIIQSFHTLQRNITSLVFCGEHFFAGSEDGQIVRCKWNSKLAPLPSIPESYLTKPLPQTPPMSPVPPRKPTEGLSATMRIANVTKEVEPPEKFKTMPHPKEPESSPATDNKSPTDPKKTLARRVTKVFKKKS